MAARRRYNALGPEGVKAVVDVVKYDMPALRELTLAWCKVGDREGAEAVAQLLQFNETLEARPLAIICCVPVILAASVQRGARGGPLAMAWCCVVLPAALTSACVGQRTVLPGMLHVG